MRVKSFATIFGMSRKVLITSAGVDELSGRLSSALDAAGDVAYSWELDGDGLGWARDANGAKAHFRIDLYLEERANWLEWRGISIRNHHRPLSTYMKLLLAQGLRLTFFDEPAPTADAPAARAQFFPFRTSG